MSSLDLSLAHNFIVDDPSVGKGSFGMVSRIRVTSNNKVYALKTFNLRDCYTNQAKKELLERSQNQYKQMKNNLPNVVRSHGSFFDQSAEKFMFTMDYYPQNLKQFVQAQIRKNEFSMPFNTFLPLFLDMINGRS